MENASLRDKAWALNQLRHQRNAFLLTLASMRLLNSDSIDKLEGRLVMLKGDDVVFDPDAAERAGARFELRFDEIIQAKMNNGQFKIDLEEFFKFTRRNLIKEGFETVKAFARQADLHGELKQQNWYAFAYVVRNSISHDLKWDFQPSSRRLLPTSWQGFEITDELQGQEFPSNALNPMRTIELISSMRAFVERF